MIDDWLCGDVKSWGDCVEKEVADDCRVVYHGSGIHGNHRGSKEAEMDASISSGMGCDDHKSTTILKSDNQGTIALTKNPIIHSRTKHIDLHHHFIRDAIENKII